MPWGVTCSAPLNGFEEDGNPPGWGPGDTRFDSGEPDMDKCKKAGSCNCMCRLCDSVHCDQHFNDCHETCTR
jgi:hypothetical protein